MRVALGAKGHNKVVAWLRLERHSASLADRKNTMATYDVTWLWTERASPTSGGETASALSFGMTQGLWDDPAR